MKKACFNKILTTIILTTLISLVNSSWNYRMLPDNRSRVRKEKNLGNRVMIPMAHQLILNSYKIIIMIYILTSMGVSISLILKKRTNNWKEWRKFSSLTISCRCGNKLNKSISGGRRFLRNFSFWCRILGS